MFITGFVKQPDFLLRNPPDRVDALTWTLATLDLNSYAEWDNSLSEGSSFASFLDDGGEDTWSQMGFSDNKNPYSRMGF